DLLTAHSFAGEEGPDVGLVLALLAGQGLDGCGGPPCQDVLARTRRGLELGLGGVVREGRGRAERGEGRGEQRGACGGAGGPEEGTGGLRRHHRLPGSCVAAISDRGGGGPGAKGLGGQRSGARSFPSGSDGSRAAAGADVAGAVEVSADAVG